MKVLIIRFSSIGDIVLTTPVVRCVKQQLLGCELHYLTKPTFKSVLSSNPYIDKLHFLDKSLSETASALKNEQFDFVIDLHNNLRTKRLKLKLGVKSSVFNKLNVQKWLLVNFKLDVMPDKHIVDRYLEAAYPLGVKNDGKGLDYFLEKEHQLNELLPESHRNYVGFVVGAQHATKKLPTYKIIEICKLIQKPILILGGKDEAAEGEEIALQSGSHVINGCGKFSLDQSAFLVKEAESIITHDTGLMHIAAAFNKRITSVWGNTMPKLGMYPYKVTEQKMFEVEGLSCRPCSKIGYKKCPRGHFKCMKEQDSLGIAGSV